MRYVVGHRGAAGYCPENTMESFRRAVELGVHALEMDVHLSANGHLVVMHDECVDRTTDGTGPISGKSLAELEALDAGFGFSPDGGKTFPWRGRGLRIPTLDEVADEFPAHRLVIEIKPGGAATAEALAAFCRRRNQPARFLAGSSNDDAMRFFRACVPDYATCASHGEARRFILGAMIACAPRPPLAYHALILSRKHHGIPIVWSGMVSAAHARGLHVHVWTINDESTIRALYDIGVNGIVSDYPDRAVRVASAKPACP